MTGNYAEMQIRVRISADYALYSKYSIYSLYYALYRVFL